MAEGLWAVILTNSERLALVDLIFEHMLNRTATTAFVDVAQSKVTRPIDLIRCVERARWLSPPSVGQNDEDRPHSDD